LGNKGYKILIVEDSRFHQEILSQVLRAEHTFIFAETGQEALEKALTERPDLIVLDIILPGMDGFEVLAEMKKKEAIRSIPVIVITGMTKIEDEAKGLTLGAVDYITKPFNSIVVKTRIDIHLKIIAHMRLIEQLSLIDSLTNIPNRRQFDLHLLNEYNRTIREKTPISILMIDVDYFKRYNDTYGHQQGDVALQTVACAIESSLQRSTDIVARWGGEEFSVLLPNTCLDGAMKIAERIRKNVEIAAIQSVDSASQHNVTISIGVATMIPTFEITIAEIIRQADEALYAAKSAGRNRACSYTSLVNNEDVSA